MESLENKTKRLIFEEAKRTSDDLVFWNHPSNKRKLNQLDQQEAEYLLWKNNKLDKLIHNKLGDNGWNNFRPNKLNDDDIDKLVNETKKLNLFLNSLPAKQN